MAVSALTGCFCFDNTIVTELEILIHKLFEDLRILFNMKMS